jgi:hypothetical protein
LIRPHTIPLIRKILGHGILLLVLNRTLGNTLKPKNAKKESIWRQMYRKASFYARMALQRDFATGKTDAPYPLLSSVSRRKCNGVHPRASNIAVSRLLGNRFDAGGTALASVVNELAIALEEKRLLKVVKT